MSGGPLIVMFGAWMYAIGYLTSRAIALEHCDPFWRGVLDGLTMRRLWQRR